MELHPATVHNHATRSARDEPLMSSDTERSGRCCSLVLSRAALAQSTTGTIVRDTNLLLPVNDGGTGSH